MEIAWKLHGDCTEMLPEVCRGNPGKKVNLFKKKKLSEQLFKEKC